jgi:hypothetical protein
MAATLALVGGAVSLALEVGSVVVPLIKGVIAKITAINTPQGTVEYTVVIATDQAELANVAQLSLADLVAISAELKAQGAPPLTLNPPTP